jgi:DNA-binding MarR family transcriptional regulator
MKTLEKRTTAEESAQALLEVAPQIMRLMRNEMRTPEGGQLSVAQFRTLAYLERRPGSALLDLVAHIGLMPPSMSKLVDGLIRRELVSREASTADRRRITLTLTVQGKSRLQRTRHHLRTRFAEVLATLPDAENERVYESLTALRLAFEARDR